MKGQKEKKQNTFQSFTTALAAAAAAALVFLLVSLLLAPKPKTASATIIFTETESDSVADTAVSRQVSGIRKAVTDRDFLESALQNSSCSVTVDELLERIEVSRIGSTSAAEISLYDLTDASAAPLILNEITTRLYECEDFPPVSVISGCDMIYSPRFPIVHTAAAFGIVCGIITWLLQPLNKSSRSRAKQAAELQSAEEAEAHRLAAVNALPLLGRVSADARDGLEKSGHLELTRKLISALGSSGAKTAAISTLSPISGMTDARFAAYIACSAAALAKHTIIIECNLTSPCLGKLFHIDSKAGLYELYNGTATINSIVQRNVKKGVDLIASNGTDPNSAGIFDSPQIKQTIHYLTGQYDLVILRAPAAWSSSACRSIYKLADILLLADSGNISDNAAHGASFTGQQTFKVKIREHL